MTRHATWHISQQMQVGSLFVMAFVIAIVLYGMWTLWHSWLDEWSIEDLTADLLMDRDQHLTGEREFMQKLRAA